MVAFWYYRRYPTVTDQIWTLIERLSYPPAYFDFASSKLSDYNYSIKRFDIQADFSQILRS